MEGSPDAIMGGQTLLKCLLMRLPPLLAPSAFGLALSIPALGGVGTPRTGDFPPDGKRKLEASGKGGSKEGP